MADMIARAWLNLQFEIAKAAYNSAIATGRVKDADLKRVRMDLLSDICLSPDTDTVLDEGQQKFVLQCVDSFVPYLYALERQEKKAEAASKRASNCLMLAGYMVRCSRTIPVATEGQEIAIAAE